MSNVNDNDVADGQFQRQFAAASLAVLVAAALGGCSVAPEGTQPQLRTAVAKQTNTYVVRRASVRTPASNRAGRHQQRNHNLPAPARKNWQQAAKRKTTTRPVVHKQTSGVQRNTTGRKALTKAQYHARYKAQKLAAERAGAARHQAKARALINQQRAKQQAVRKQHIARWEQQKKKRLLYNANWERQQAQNRARALAGRKARPATHKSGKAVRSPANQRAIRLAAQQRLQAKRNAARAATAGKVAQQPNRQIYLARWEQAQAKKRLAARRAKAEKHMAARKAAQKVESVITNAKKQIGRKYVWGGASPRRGFDCSGLVQHSIKKGANVKVPRTAAQQYKAAVKVPANKAQRGDLVFFITRGKSVSHVGIYLGNNKFVHAPRTGKRVTTTNLKGYWKKRFVGFGRIPGACRLPI